MEGTDICLRKFRLRCKLDLRKSNEKERTDSKQNQLLITRPQTSISILFFVWIAGHVVEGLDKMAGCNWEIIGL